MIEIILHQQETEQLLNEKKLQTQEVQINNVQALNVVSVVMENICSGKENSNSKTAFNKLVKESSLDSKTKDFYLDYDCQMTYKYFVEYTEIKVKHFRDTLLQHMRNVKKSVAERTHHQRQYDRRVNKRQMQTQENKVDMGKALDDDADDADIRPIYDEEPMAESFAVYEKTSPRSYLRWKPTGRILKVVGLRWIPTGKLLDSCTSKVDCGPPHGSNVDISKIHERKQTLDLSTGTPINVQKKQSIDLSAGTSYNVNKKNLRVWLLKKLISQKPVLQGIHN
ncbi:hypothetical protein Tco_0098189 [Tanacetum coccineum]